MPTFTLRKFLLSALVLFVTGSAQAQDKQYELKASSNNFNTFTTKARQPDAAWTDLNKDYVNSPDAVLTSAVSDPSGMVELYDRRTQSSKYFINPAKPSEFVKEQALGAIHYLKNGAWTTIDTRLNPVSATIFEASRQTEPVGFNVQTKESFIKTDAGTITFNKWELYGKNAGGVATLLATANWTNYTAGDNGLFVKNIFPGIDASMIVRKGGIKTNFIINNNQFSGYASFMFKDALQTGAGGTLAFENTNATTFTGNVNFKLGGTNVLSIQKAYAFTQTTNPAHAALTDLSYTLSNNKLFLNIDANYINTQLAYGKVVIDPMVQTFGSIAQALITGSMNCGSILNNCTYTLNLAPPAGATITAVAVKFGVFVAAPLTGNQALFNISAGTCNGSLTGAATAFGPININTPDSAGGFAVPGYSDLLSAALLPCMPAVSCTPAPIPFLLKFWNTYCAGPVNVCSNTYVSANSEFAVRIRGNINDFLPPRITRSTPTQSVCLGQQVTLTRNIGTGGFAPYTYSWAPGGQTTQAITVSPTANTIYTSIITDACGRSVTDTTQLFIVNNNIPPTVVSPQNVCQFDNTPLSAVGPNLRWFTTATGGVGSPVAPIPPTVPGTYNYYVSSVGQCGESPRVKLTIVVIAKPAPPTVVSPLGVCQYAQVQLQATGQNLQWYETPVGGFGTPTKVPNTDYVDSFYYYVTQTINGCESDRARLRLFVNYKPNAIVLPSRLFVCEGDTAQFNYYGNAYPDMIYNWSTSRPYNEIIFGQGTPGPMIVRFDSAGLRQVNIQINNKGCLSNVGTQTITVRPNPRLVFNVPDNVCKDEILNVGLSAISPIIDSFNYIFPGGNVVYGANSGGPFGVKYQTPGQYIIGSMAFSRQCPGRYFYDTITVRPLGDARINASKLDICQGDSILFRASGVPDSNTQYNWTPAAYFASGNIYQSWGVVKNPGYVKLRATSQYGCVGQDSVKIDARVCCEMFFPNAFSPNGDGKNDIFKPVTNGHQDIKNFRIINRWGQVVYETREDRAGWNGVYNGRDQDAGTFYYYIRYNCRDGNDDIEQKGEMLLLR